MRSTAGFPIMGALMTALTLTGCAAPQGVTIPPVPDDFEPCDSMSSSADNLGAGGAPECDMAGSGLTLPDGTRVTIPAIGSVFTTQQPLNFTDEYHVVNWGTAGVGVAQVRDREAVQVWASTPEAEKLQIEQAEVDNIGVGQLTE